MEGVPEEEVVTGDVEEDGAAPEVLFELVGHLSIPDGGPGPGRNNPEYTDLLRTKVDLYL